jgi:hypothetical protein
MVSGARVSRLAVGRAAVLRPWSFQPWFGSQPAERSRGAGRAEARRPKRGTWKGTAEENAPSKRTNHFELCIRTQCVSRCQDHSTPCLSAARASRGDRSYRMSRLVLASELLWVGVASEPLALRSVGDGVTALRYRLLARSAVSSTHVKRHGSHHRADAVEPAPLSIGSSIAIR